MILIHIYYRHPELWVHNEKSEEQTYFSVANEGTHPLNVRHPELWVLNEKSEERKSLVARMKELSRSEGSHSG